MVQRVGGAVKLFLKFLFAGCGKRNGEPLDVGRNEFHELRHGRQICAAIAGTRCARSGLRCSVAVVEDSAVANLSLNWPRRRP